MQWRITEALADMRILFFAGLRYTKLYILVLCSNLYLENCTSFQLRIHTTDLMKCRSEGGRALGSNHISSSLHLAFQKPCAMLLHALHDMYVGGMGGGGGIPRLPVPFPCSKWRTKVSNLYCAEGKVEETGSNSLPKIRQGISKGVAVWRY